MESQLLLRRAMKAALKANTGTAASNALRQFDDWSPMIEDLNSYVLQLTTSTDCINK
jgi:hypothetical protein